MRQNVFIFILIALVFGIVGYFIFMVLKAFYTVYDDARTEKQLDSLATEYSDRRRVRREAAEARMNNGCEHAYDDLLGAFPKGVCIKCGLSKELPPGECDHLWKRVAGPVPGSKCEKCGELYGAAAEV